MSADSLRIAATLDDPALRSQYTPVTAATHTQKGDETDIRNYPEADTEGPVRLSVCTQPAV